MAFINALKQYLRHHEYSDLELITIIQNKLPSRYYQMAENLLIEIRERGVMLTSDLFIHEMNTLLSGKGNGSINYNLRLSQSDIDHFDFSEYSSHKFFALTSRKSYLKS